MAYIGEVQWALCLACMRSQSLSLLLSSSLSSPNLVYTGYKGSFLPSKDVFWAMGGNIVLQFRVPERVDRNRSPGASVPKFNGYHVKHSDHR